MIQMRRSQYKPLANYNILYKKENSRVVENIMAMHSAKSLKTTYLTWQIFFEKSKPFLIFTSESHWKIINPTVLFLWVFNWNLKRTTSTFLEADKQLNVFFCSLLRIWLMLGYFVCKKCSASGDQPTSDIDSVDITAKKCIEKICKKFEEIFLSTKTTNCRQ